MPVSPGSGLGLHALPCPGWSLWVGEAWPLSTSLSAASTLPCPWGSFGLGLCTEPGRQRPGAECVPLVSSRVGQRGSGLSMSAARSEHEVSEIIDGLSEQEVRAWL